MDLESETIRLERDKVFYDVHKIPGEEKPLLVVEGEKTMHFCNNDPYLSKHYKTNLVWWSRKSPTFQH